MEEVIKNRNNNLFKNKNFMLLLIGQIVSNIGNALHSVAVTWYILNLVGEELSGTYLAIFMMCMLIPNIIFGPISGVFVDKLSRKKLIVGTDIIRGSLILILGLLTYFKIYPLISLYVITTLNSFFGTFFNPAVSASVPNVVDENNLMKANSINGTSRQLTFIFGTAAAGFLIIYTGIVGIFIINGLSFISSGISETFINLPKVKKNDTEKSSFFKDFVDGIKYLKGHKVIMILLGFAIFINFLFNPIFAIVFPKTIKFTLEQGPKQFGVFESLFSIGALAGMLLISILPKREKYCKMILFGITIQSLILMLFGVPIIPSIHAKLTNFSVYIIFCILAFVLMIFNTLINIPIFTLFQKRVDDEYRGRFFGILSTLTQGIVPLGLLVIGFLSDIIHSSVLYIAAGILSLVLSIWMMFIKELREL